jgi:3-oxoacyl-(acyl-carrier-protein) synthase
MSTRVSITGLGSVGCNGLGPDALFQSALRSESAISQGLGKISPATLDELKLALPRLADDSRSLLLAATAAGQAMKQAGWDRLGPDDAVILATTTGQISLWEDLMLKFLKGEASAEEAKPALREQPIGLTLSKLVSHVNHGAPFVGKTLLLSSACSAATQAIGVAAAWIRAGRIKRCLVGGTEVLSTLTIEGFRSLQLLSNDPSTPFDAGRKGINLSEGAAFLCLEADGGPRTLASVSGFGFSTDAYHPASPHPEGIGSLAAMRLALKTAGLDPRDIGWVHAHGTGSQANDVAEGAAVRSLFGEDSERTGPWVSSTKNVHGHALGASGVIETVLCIESLRQEIVLATSGLRTPDPLIRVRHPMEHRKTRVDHILKNTLGFGGNNASIVISREGA